MSTHLSPEEIKGYLARSLTRNDFNRVGSHVHSCETCYQSFLYRLQYRFPILIDLDELAGLKDWHLERDELGAYVEGRLEELDFECATLHLQECRSCMEKASAAFERTLEHPRSKIRALSNPSSFWNRYLPAFQATSLPRLRFAAVAVLLFALALIAWTVLQPKHERSELAGAGATEPVSPSTSQQLTSPSQPTVGAGSNISKKGEERQPDKPEGRRKEGVLDRPLIARNLTMPSSIETLDRTPSIAIRGTPSFNRSFKVISPLATLVMSDRPTFRWTASSEAKSYTVSVFDAALNLIRTSDPLTETQWLIPEPLEVGMVYTWTVSAQKDGQDIVAPAPPARAEFKVIGRSELLELRHKMTRTASHAARGILYAEAGLIDEAEEEFGQYLQQHPRNNHIMRLRHTIRSWRSR
jgi:hypothetical protein